MAKRQTLADFSDEIVSVPDFAPGPYGMDLVIRGDMKKMMGAHRRENGYKGLRAAVLKYLRENNIKLKDDIEDA